MQGNLQDDGAGGAVDAGIESSVSLPSGAVDMSAIEVRPNDLFYEVLL